MAAIAVDVFIAKFNGYPSLNIPLYPPYPVCSLDVVKSSRRLCLWRFSGMIMHNVHVSTMYPQYIHKISTIYPQCIHSCLFLRHF